MSKKKTTKLPANVKKQYANFAHCSTCSSEQQMRRVVVVGTGSKNRWACKSCGDLIPAHEKAPSRAY